MDSTNLPFIIKEEPMWEDSDQVGTHAVSFKIEPHSDDEYAQSEDDNLDKAPSDSSFSSKGSDNNSPEPDENNLQCKHCRKYYKNKHTLRRHIQSQHFPKTLKCTECSKTFNCRDNLQKHMRVHRPASFECSVCGRHLKRIDSLHYHLHTQHGLTIEGKSSKKKSTQFTYTCHQCKQQFRYRKELTRHMNSCHGEKDSNTNTSNLTPIQKQDSEYDSVDQSSSRNERLPCAVCRRVYSRRDTLNFHMYTQHGLSPSGGATAPYTCPVCHETFRYSKACKQHLKRIHSMSDSNDSPENVIETPKVDKQSSLVEASLTPESDNDVTPKSKYECTVCGKVLKRSNAFHYHMFNQHGITVEGKRNTNLAGPHKCEFCLQVFTYSRDFTKHLLCKHDVYNDQKDGNTENNTGTKRRVRPKQECKICRNVYSSMNSLNYHMYTHHREAFNKLQLPGWAGKYTCYICHDTFLYRKAMQRHVAKCGRQTASPGASLDISKTKKTRRSSSGSTQHYFCYLCPHTDTLSNLSLHFLAVHPNSGFDEEHCKPAKEETKTQAAGLACPHCYMIFGDETSLQEHLKRDDPMTSLGSHIALFRQHNFVCVQCKLVFTIKHQIYEHFATVHASDTLKCDRCGDIFAYNTQLVAHTRSCGEENNRDVETNPTTIEGDAVICEECPDVFPSISAMLKHLEEGHGRTDGNWPCQLCGKVLRYTSGRHRHLHLCHVNDLLKRGVIDEQRAEQLRRPYQRNVNRKIKDKAECDVCNRVFVDRRIYERHVTRFHTVATCPSCDKVFANRIQLTAHMQSEHRQRRFLCDVCSYATTTASRLRRHMMYHAPPQIECQHCGKFLHHSEALRSHMRKVHKKQPERPKCPMCPRKFFSIDSFNRHLLTHEDKGERVPPSERAEKQQGASGVITANRKCACKLCDALFASRASLLRHVYASHASDGPYRCVTCGEAFLNALRFKSHVYRHRRLQLVGYAAKKDALAKCQSFSNKMAESESHYSLLIGKVYSLASPVTDKLD